VGYVAWFTGLTAEAELQPNELQDLADQIGELVKLTVGLELTLRVRLEIGGSKTVPAVVRDSLNEKLQAINPHWTLR
jgi:hypothetical protein